MVTRVTMVARMARLPMIPNGRAGIVMARIAPVLLQLCEFQALQERVVGRRGCPVMPAVGTTAVRVALWLTCHPTHATEANRHGGGTGVCTSCAGGGGDCLKIDPSLARRTRESHRTACGSLRREEHETRTSSLSSASSCNTCMSPSARPRTPEPPNVTIAPRTTQLRCQKRGAGDRGRTTLLETLGPKSTRNVSLDMSDAE